MRNRAEGPGGRYFVRAGKGGCISVGGAVMVARTRAPALWEAGVGGPWAASFPQGAPFLKVIHRVCERSVDSGIGTSERGVRDDGFPAQTTFTRSFEWELLH
ncbi:hypothetical protein GCM10010329_21760 [Streptomyces spiroverticillatus]|nr:hypothetical protein GCM10010329_21760 [Streptomyces spiroverticillatus]